MPSGRRPLPDAGGANASGQYEPLRCGHRSLRGEEFIALARFTTARDIEEIAETMRQTVQDLSLTHERRRDGGRLS